MVVVRVAEAYQVREGVHARCGIVKLHGLFLQLSPYDYIRANHCEKDVSWRPLRDTGCTANRCYNEMHSSWKSSSKGHEMVSAQEGRRLELRHLIA